jgi:hypothetical protein
MSASGRQFAWVLNLDAELELAQTSYNAPTRLLAQLAEHGRAALDLLGANDVLVKAGAAVEGLYTGRAWCPTPRAVALLRAAGVEPEPHPALSVLRRVNHRRFAFELGGGLPGQHYVEERSPLEALLRRAEHPWLLKRPLTFAGRGQLRVYTVLTDKQSSWIDASLRNDGLIAEPLVLPMLECSLHGFLWRDGRHELGRICVQEVSARGVFRGVRRAESSELEANESDALFAQGERTALALGTAGYFGPFGIDAYRYKSELGSGFCALGEINARYTLGFLTGFPRHPSELALA